MSSWKITKFNNIPKLTSPILIEGLPGIGNVGKIVADFIVDELKAKKIYNFFSYTLPHSVFVNENNLVELPRIDMYYKSVENERDLLLLTGDVQPVDEVSCYEFCETILSVIEEYKVREIITLGGIGLREVPKTPKVYCTGNSKKALKKYKKYKSISTEVYGVVGPVIGVSGLLVGLAKKKNVDAVALLAETYGHPLFLGLKGAREILKNLNKIFNLNIDLKNLNKEIKDLEKDFKLTKDLVDVSKKAKYMKKLPKDTSYIG
ncbi:PAC2 family protein [Candidatus Woesearchaeota archaeon]|nr:PAC2 family protein [Candidatus Woesearchaeota archaeon]